MRRLQAASSDPQVDQVLDVEEAGKSSGTVDQRQLISLVSPDVPTKFTGKSKIDSSNNQFINFDATSADKDVS